MLEINNKFVSYYQNEISYLRNAGRIFSKNYPKIARRLNLSDLESSDPHVERLLESFAFLTAKISQEIDDRYPETAASLLGVLYPHLIAPIPSMSMCQFNVDHYKGKLGNGYMISKNTSLFAYSAEDVICKFQTVYPVNLLPLTINNVYFWSKEACISKDFVELKPWYLCISFKTNGINLKDVDFRNLRICLQGERYIKNLIYQNLFAQNDIRVFISNNTENDKKVISPMILNSLSEVGFKRDEMALPISKYTNHSYQMLQEYFHFPDKFLFFDIDNLNIEQKKGSLEGDFFEILIPVANPSQIIHEKITKDNFQLSCTPIINLFHKITDPLKLDHKKLHYRLVPDQRREKTTEIFSVESVESTINGRSESQTFSPYFSLEHFSKDDKQQIFWTQKRVSAQNRDVAGTDVLLSFVDLSFNPQFPSDSVIYAKTLCSNRFLAEQLPAGSQLQIEEKIPLAKITCLERPNSQIYSPLDGDTLWMLVSQLSVNHLSLNQNVDSARALKELLYIYANPYKDLTYVEIEQIKALTSKNITRRVGKDYWRGFVQGTEITLEFEKMNQFGQSNFLLASILRHYFSMSINANNFLELVVKDQSYNGELMRWDPLPTKLIQI
jgi:type VI secretion system protein ImpG